MTWNKEKMVEILKAQIEQGFKIIQENQLTVKDINYGQIMTNILNAGSEVDRLTQEIAFDKEQAQRLEMLNKKAS